MIIKLPSEFLDNSLKRIDVAVRNEDYSKLQGMKVLDNENCPMDTLNVEGEIFNYGGQIVENVAYFNEDKTKRLFLQFGKGAKIEDWQHWEE